MLVSFLDTFSTYNAGCASVNLRYSYVVTDFEITRTDLLINLGFMRISSRGARRILTSSLG